MTPCYMCTVFITICEEQKHFSALYHHNSEPGPKDLTAASQIPPLDSLTISGHYMNRIRGMPVYVCASADKNLSVYSSICLDAPI